jgi:hypothetical protein
MTAALVPLTKQYKIEATPGKFEVLPSTNTPLACYKTPIPEPSLLPRGKPTLVTL